MATDTVAPASSVSKTSPSSSQTDLCWIRWLVVLGDFTRFSLQTVQGLGNLRSLSRTTIPIAYQVGLQSLAVVMITGVFVGLVLAVEAYNQYHRMGLDSALGSIVNLTILRELGPVLTGVMLAGRVGSAIAAELATMRVTDQIDAIECLGVHPVHYLVTPRFLACLGMIPFLTILANFAGVVAGASICFTVFEIDQYFYWEQARRAVGPFEVFSGVAKSVLFGAALALIACHRGFRSRGGAVGVGRAATEAFVFSFVAILVLDFLTVLLIQPLQELLNLSKSGIEFG